MSPEYMTSPDYLETPEYLTSYWDNSGVRLYLDAHSTASNPYFHGCGGRMVTHVNTRTRLHELKVEESELLDTMRIMRVYNCF